MKYVLVHGAMHGAWCWSRLTDCLRSRGIDSVAVELPGHGTRVDELATLESYRDAVIDVVDQGDILVAHSMGGYVITLAADVALDRIGGLIYLAAAVPEEGRSIPRRDIAQRRRLGEARRPGRNGRERPVLHHA